MMAKRAAMPIHNPEGKVIAYAVCFPGEPNRIPKYKLPRASIVKTLVIRDWEGRAILWEQSLKMGPMKVNSPAPKEEVA